MKMFPRILSIVALTALTLAATPVARAQSPAAKAPASQPAAGVPKAADLPGFAPIPAGEFTMGDALDGDKDAPPHKVSVSAFYMQKTEVTKAQWDEVRAWGVKNGYTDLPEGNSKAANHPVQSVSWYDVVKWCNARSEKDGLTPCYTVSGVTYRTGSSDVAVCNWAANGYRLPTEAEWEKAARDGLSGKRFPWGDTISHEQANFMNYGEENYQSGSTGPHPLWDSTGDFPYTSPVGSFTPNGYGLYDMAGNVWEWCWDWYGNYFVTPQTDPCGAVSGEFRITRGGGWSGGATLNRTAYRGHSYFLSSYCDRGLGFRPARSSVP